MARSRIFRIAILAAVSLLVLSLAAPAGATKGGIPRPPSGSVLDVTVEPTSGFMWANSVGDEIEFKITITNTGSETLLITSATFGSDPLIDGDLTLAKNESWETPDDNPYVYTVEALDLDNLALQQISTVELKDIVLVNGPTPTLEETGTATFTAYPVAPCDDPEVFAEAFELLDNGFSWGPFDGYTVCAYAFDGADTWMLTTLLPKKAPGKSMPPSATIRDGVPGNWCQADDGYVDGQTVVDIAHFPQNGTCLRGGAGGESIPVRNTTTYYLATWAGNTVTAMRCLQGVPWPCP